MRTIFYFVAASLSLILLGGTLGCAYKECLVNIEQVNALLNSIESEKVSKIEVYRLPYALKTFVNVTPQTLVEMSKPMQVDLTKTLRDELTTAIRKMNCERDAAQSDLRWGAHFLNAKGRCIHKIYLNAGGDRMIVDGVSLRTTRQLVRCFEKHFGKGDLKK